jgi:hypothetical protein
MFRKLDLFRPQVRVEVLAELPSDVATLNLVSK